jgi:hypothetical protein
LAVIYLAAALLVAFVLGFAVGAMARAGRSEDD